VRLRDVRVGTQDLFQRADVIGDVRRWREQIRGDAIQALTGFRRSCSLRLCVERGHRQRSRGHPREHDSTPEIEHGSQ
jgi:hypothetical protein